MKTLTDYTMEAVGKLLDDKGAFFAFGSEQFEEKKVAGLVYVALGAGLICPKDNAIELWEGLDRIQAEGVAQDLAENGKKNIIRRELANYEYAYTYDLDDTAAAVECYGITPEEVAEEAKAYMVDYRKWEEAEARGE